MNQGIQFWEKPESKWGLRSLLLFLLLLLLLLLLLFYCLLGRFGGLLGLAEVCTLSECLVDKTLSCNLLFS